MPYGKFTLNDGREVPEIAFGAGTALFDKNATAAVLQALDAGFTHLDNAQMYKNEETVREAIEQSKISRDKLYITTKFGGGDIEEEFRRSLNKLGVDYVDLYLIHFPRFTPDFAKAWAKFEELKERGVAKSVGISNFSLEQLQELLKTAKVKPAVNQISFHPYNYAQNKSLLEFASAQGILIESYHTLAPITKQPGGPLDPVLERIAKRMGATPAQVILRWARQKGVLVVTTTGKKERLQEYLDAADIPALTPEEIADIEKAGENPPTA